MEIIKQIRDKIKSLQIPPTIMNIVIIIAIAYIISSILSMFSININYKF